nr:hypothetical protein [Tanacetum cinerariifolium]
MSNKDGINDANNATLFDVIIVLPIPLVSARMVDEEQTRLVTIVPKFDMLVIKSLMNTSEEHPGYCLLFKNSVGDGLGNDIREGEDFTKHTTDPLLAGQLILRRKTKAVQTEKSASSVGIKSPSPINIATPYIVLSEDDSQSTDWVVHALFKEVAQDTILESTEVNKDDVARLAVNLEDGSARSVGTGFNERAVGTRRISRRAWWILRSNAHKACSKNVQKLTDARENIQKCFHIYTNLSGRHKRLSEEHSGCVENADRLKKDRDDQSGVNKNQLLNIQEYNKSLAEPFNKVIVVGWMKGLSVGRTEEEIIEILKETFSFDAHAVTKLDPHIVTKLDPHNVSFLGTIYQGDYGFDRRYVSWKKTKEYTKN